MFAKAESLAGQLNARMLAPEVRAAISEVHKLGGRSQDVQEILRTDLEALGFQPEKSGLFAATAVSRTRPEQAAPRPSGGSGTPPARPHVVAPVVPGRIGRAFRES